MKRQHLTLSVVAGILIFTLLGTAHGQGLSLNSPPYPATVDIDSVVAQRGANVAVPIRLVRSSIAIEGITIPLHFDASRLTFGSVDYSGSIVPADWFEADHLTGADTLKLIMIPGISYDSISHITVDNGLLATLMFHVRDDAPLGSASIDALDFTDTIITATYDTTFSPEFRVDTLWDTLMIWTHPQLADTLGQEDFGLEVRNGAVEVQMPTDVGDNGNSGLPAQFGLDQNYPNPFNPTTAISFSIPRSSHVRLEIFNVLGQKIETLLDRDLAAGDHQVEFNASAQPSGVYFYRLTAGDRVATRKMVLLK